MDWKSIFLPDVPLPEIILRGTLTYIVLFFLLRVVLKRRTDSIGMTDLLLITLLADAAQNGMAGWYNAVTKEAYMESAGHFSVVQQKPKQRRKNEHKGK